MERVAGLILHAPRRKHMNSWCLPRGSTYKGAWKAATAAAYTFSVDLPDDSNTRPLTYCLLVLGHGDR